MRCLFFFLFIGFINFAAAHDYYFAFAEMEYNETSRKLELTLTVSTHDIEHYFEDNNINIKEIEHHITDTLMIPKFSDALQKGFSITQNNRKIEFKIIGFKVNLQGTTDFFFESESIDFLSPLTVRFDLLMQENQQQQNKLTFIHKQIKKAFSFTIHTKEHIVSQDIFKE